MNRIGLRWVMLWPVVLTLSIGALGLGIYVERSVRADLVQRIDDELTRALNASGLRPDGPDGPERPPPNPDDQTANSVEVPIQLLLDETGTVILDTPNSAAIDERDLAELAGTAEVRTIDGTPRYRVSTSPTRDGDTVLVALSLEDVDESLASLRRNLFLGGLVLFALQATVVWLIATAVARPVTRMSDAAHRIAGGEFDTEVGAPQGPRETAALATDLDQMLDRLRHTITVQERSAARANQAKLDMERFMADASHELSTPLTALRGYSDLFERGMLDEDGLDRAMSRIGSESERLSRLVGELLELTRHEEREEGVDLAAIVSAVVHDLRAANPSRAISIETGSADELVVIGNPHRLHQAVLNLASNACQHTSAETPIELQVQQEHRNVDGGGAASGDVATVSVIDHGAGVDPDNVDELFLPFTRGDASRSRRSHDGAGLGLALVRRIAEQHRGTVGVIQTPGGGATFRLSVPVDQSEAD